jgi:hypothetical protein
LILGKGFREVQGMTAQHDSSINMAQHGNESISFCCTLKALTVWPQLRSIHGKVVSSSLGAAGSMKAHWGSEEGASKDMSQTNAHDDEELVN